MLVRIEYILSLMIIDEFVLPKIIKGTKCALSVVLNLLPPQKCWTRHFPTTAPAGITSPEVGCQGWGLN